MKNKRLEEYIKTSKRVASKAFNNRNYDPVRKIKVYHIYDDPRAFSYWDDVTFKYGSQAVYVWWTHPRYMYSDHVDQQAYNEAEKLTERRKQDINEMFNKKNPHYRKVGKSRKKVVSYECNIETPEGFYDTWKKLSKAYMLTSDHVEYAKFSVEQMRHGLGVSISCPIEVLNEDGLKELAELVKKCLIDRTLFNTLFGNYSYGCKDFAKEFPDGETKKFESEL